MNNTLFLIGRITKDLELRYTPNNKSVVNVSLAVNNAKDDTTFIDVSLFGQIAETTHKYCHKGDLMGVQAIVKNHNWEDKDGKKHYDYSFIANKVSFLSTKKEKEAPKEKSNSEIIKDTMEGKNPFEEFGEQISIDDDNFLD